MPLPRRQLPATIPLPGLDAPAEIRVDRYGVPHIRASSERDAFMVQGFNAARDRLWQIDIWRKRGLGLLTADFGPGYLAQDRAARLFLYRGDMAAEWAAYGVPGLRDIVTAFTDGINAYVAVTEADPSLLPPEFGATDTRPARWAPEDVVRIRSHALVRNLTSEVMRARLLVRARRLAGDAGAAADDAAALAIDLARRSIAPAHDIAVPDGLDPEDIGPRVLDAFLLATAPVTFDAERLAATPDQAERWSRVDGLGEVVSVPEGMPIPTVEGSNNWAVAGHRTATGRPLLASDPHRAYGLPSLRYVAHLTAPGLDIIGAGEPAMPGIAIGHNGHAAFALTIFPADQEDLFVCETSAIDPDLYRRGDDWARMTVVRETIPVRGFPAAVVDLRFTAHGPVIFEDGPRRRAFAVRTVWSEPGSAPYLASLGYRHVRSPEDYAAALASWSVPSTNHVYADIDGQIAWIVAAKLPVRPASDGLLPVPGDGRYDWSGFHDPADLPRSIDPTAGFVATANEMNLPDGPARDRGFGFEWLEPFRATRIRHVLSSDAAQDVDTAAALQGDVWSEPATRICRHLPAAAAAAGTVDADTRLGLDLLTGWDHRLTLATPAALVFEIWWQRHLRPALLDRATADPVLRQLIEPGDPETLLDHIDDDARCRDACLLPTLSAAVAECRDRFGDDTAAWDWGCVHHGYFEHPLSRIDAAGAMGTDRLDIGPLPVGGSGATVMNTTYRPDGRLIIGASFRMVADVGNWDASRFVNAPGQSGDPASAHYADHAGVWAEASLLPLLYSAEAVDAATELVIHLVPTPQAS
ncbi:penicillin amidase [Tistrella bauzanensis]|uniref:Penicillin amidase n=1 Tax=Tistrella bauzanensis TaxID=657419 RepID=A0ABQ1J6U1_9PROT|nr:penicillin acylase family protein [Tistrella bauzanensis]GGB58886.1 penicillin amidase [Tistrella bauzanensis]